jgi:predicted transcriptional regulator YdeE
MTIEAQAAPITIVGLELRTSNEVASQEIPALWQRFYAEAILERIPNKLATDVYAVYTHFEHEGLNNTGTYSCVIGAPVPDGEPVPPGLIAVRLPASTYQVVPVPSGRPEQVGAVWQVIWQQDASHRTFIADFERYRADGTIDILLGIRS